MKGASQNRPTPRRQPASHGAGKPPALRIRTARLTIRPFRPSDKPVIAAMLADPQERRFLETGGRRLSPDRLAAKLVADSRSGPSLPRWSLAILPRGKRRPIGGILLAPDETRSAEIGIWLSPAVRGQGLAREALSAVIRRAFASLPLRRVTGTCDAGHAAARRLLEACGLRAAHRLTFDEGGRRQRRLVLVLDAAPPPDAPG